MKSKNIIILFILVLSVFIIINLNKLSSINKNQVVSIENFYDNGSDDDGSNDDGSNDDSSNYDSSNDDSSNDDSSNDDGSGAGQTICFKKTPRNPTVFNDLKMFQKNIKQLNTRMDSLQKQINSLKSVRQESLQHASRVESEF